MNSSEYGVEGAAIESSEALCRESDEDHVTILSDWEADHVNSDEEEVTKNDEGISVGSEVLDRKLACKDLLGQIVHSEEEAYKLYCDYGHCLGFSVRKGKQHYFTGTKNIRTKDYYCSKEGYKSDEGPTVTTFHRSDTRTGCKAMIRFTVDEQGKWKVTRFIDEHNHEFAAPQNKHLLRSARSVSGAKVSVLDPIVNTGVQTVNSYPNMAEEAGGAENVGFRKKDYCNYINTQNMTLIEAEDSQSLFYHLKHRANQEGMFYWDVQLDQEGRMTNFYWRDGRSRIDYDCFGDVVIFNTTYRTNKYNILCAPFVGVNHHSQDVMFGCAFLLDETAASFEWLFNTFLDSMGDRAPKTIFTNQDPEMEMAIEKVFSNTHHRLYLWHISKNAPSHLGSLNSNREFHHLFNKCLQGCESEEEFEETWVKMILKYDLERHEWLANLYKIRQKWCTALNIDIFDGGTSRRSERKNNVLNGIADNSTSLTQFVIAFENLVKGWRRNEADEDYRSHQSAPARAIKHSNFLKHAAKVYTHKVYKFFEKEYLDGVGAFYFEETPCGGTLFRYDLRLQGRGSKVWVVHIDTSTMEVKCSCKKFETAGVLCSHALAALNLKNAHNIPEQYIHKRWTKDAKRRVYTYAENESSTQDANEAELVFHNRAMRYAYDLVTMSQGNEEARKILWGVLDDGDKAIRDFFKNVSLDAHSLVTGKEPNGEDNEGIDEDNETAVLDQPCGRPKEVSNSRLEGHLEKRRKKSSQGETGERSTIVRTVKQAPAGKGSQKSVLPPAQVNDTAPSPTATTTCGLDFIAQAQVARTPVCLGFPNHPTHSKFRPIYPKNVFMPQVVYPLHNFTSQMNAQTSTVSQNLSGHNIPFTSMSQGVGLATNLSQEASNYVWRPEPSNYAWKPPM